jgi:hypothetical protein
MRIGFRTTIEKDLVESLKKQAIKEGVNANDILEKLLYAYLIDGISLGMMDEMKKNMVIMEHMATNDKMRFIENRVAFDISRAFLECGVDLRAEQEFIINHIAEALIKIISYNMVFLKDRKNN